MNELKAFIRSFMYAGKGIAFCFRNERNFRFHLCAAIAATAFSRICGNFSSAEFAVLALTIAAVISTELINSALEMISDTVTSAYNEGIGHAKDMAAAGVLITAIASLCVGIRMFAARGRFGILFDFFSSSWTKILALAIYLILSYIFVFVYGNKKIRKNHDKNKQQ